ncbi:hypothetical protein Tco_0771257 [Tanacetum coccineum]|uniref:Uncharacterized protein n=1 Tax=Tanacetum coccineum TaxID=301880 RepID=A0ABQ4ZH52_9ASTR
MVVCEICKPWGTISTKSNRSQRVSERECFSHFLVIGVYLDEFSSSCKDDRPGQDFLSSFFISDDNIKAWSKRIYRTSALGLASFLAKRYFIAEWSCSVLELQSWFCWHSGLVENACSFSLYRTAQLQKSLEHNNEFG